MRRNLKRKEDYLKRKEAEERENSTDMEPSSQVKKTFKCSQCDNDFKSENGAIMQNMIFDSVFEVDSVLENESDFFDSCWLQLEQKNLK